MISRTTRDFRKRFRGLPTTVREQARSAYKRFETDPLHPSLRFKQLLPGEPDWSARVSLKYRVIGRRESDDLIVWYFIGTHDDYDRTVADL